MVVVIIPCPYSSQRIALQPGGASESVYDMRMSPHLLSAHRISQKSKSPPESASEAQIKMGQRDRLTVLFDSTHTGISGRHPDVTSLQHLTIDYQAPERAARSLSADVKNLWEDALR